MQISIVMEQAGNTGRDTSASPLKSDGKSSYGSEIYNAEDLPKIVLRIFPKNIGDGDGSPEYITLDPHGPGFDLTEGSPEPKKEVKPISNPAELFSNILKGSSKSVETMVGVRSKRRKHGESLDDFVNKMNRKISSSSQTVSSDDPICKSVFDTSGKASLTSDVQEKKEPVRRFVFVDGKLMVKKN